jgi:Ca-activated chloride channel family protein
MKTTRAMSASCELKIGTLVEKIKEVELAQGESTVTFEAKVKEGGEKRVSVSCKTTREEDDRFKSNNRFAISLKIPDRPKVLYVEGERRYRKNLLAALDRDFKVELRGPRGVPSSLSDAKKFDLIFVSDVPRAGRMGYANMSTKQMKVLERYARAGGGIIFSGGENSFGPGGYGGTYLERKVLPVLLNVQKKEDIPGLALMLVIDRSGSMSGSKLELAKEAARATLDVLQPSDKLGVITFDSRPTTVVRLQRAANRMRIGQSLARITPGGGTEIFPALDKAYQELTSTNAKVKHIILLTDGQSNRSGILELVSQSYQDRITISTVAVGRGSDTSLLIQVAEEGGGRYYFTDRAANIPKLFLKETSEVSRRALVEDRFRPRIPRAFRRLQIFRGLNTKRFPSLLGYVATRPKRRAEVLMISHLKEPILARWRLGLGKVVVWTSDVKNRWSHYWLKWPGYAQFWRQLIRDSRRVEKETPTFNMVADISQGILSVGVDAVDRNDRFIDGLESKVNVIGPKGTSSSLTLKQTAAGRYEGKLPLKEYGPYTIKGKHNPTANPTKTFESYSMVAWPFPSEHLVGEPNLTQVEDMAQMTSGRKAPTNARLFDNEGKEKEKHTPLWAYPLYLILGLLILDLLLRRVRFYGSTTIRWKDIRQET